LGGLPTVAVDDILVHPRDLDLVVATHGRSLYVLDDVRPLQELSSDVLAKEAHLFPLRPAVGFYPLPGFVDWGGTAVFRGANPPEGALISFYLKEYTGDPVKIAIKAPGGRPVANLTAPGSPGLNRISWDLKPTKDLLFDYGGEGPRFVAPGEYTVTLTSGKTKQEQRLKVELAPGIETRW
ncbi:MAG TPA: hypothetical protein VKI41_06685, partial [Vicinamibacteria bacterium]|nr:hypothetical protein [Vicinamibacteria bacterium]